MYDRLAKCIFIWILFLLFVACRDNENNTHLLLQADSLMNSSPDSALYLLESIKEPQKMNRASRAQYALLMTQAWDKNWMPITNDSLIQTAVDYYKDSDDKMQASKAYYYLGCVNEDLDNTVEATNVFLKALIVSPKNALNAKLKSMIYEGVGRCYTRQGFYDKALSAFRTAYKISSENDSKEGMIPPLTGIIDVFIYQYQWDSAVWKIHSVLPPSVHFNVTP